MTVNRRLSAMHEAAHAVVAHALGHIVNSIQVHAEAKRQGRYEVHAVTWHQPPLDVNYDPMRSAIISAAGDQAEGGRAPRRVRSVKGCDLQDLECNPALSRCYINAGLRGYTLRVAEREARRLVAKHWDAIERVAAAVEKAPRGRLSGRAFRSVVGIERGCVDACETRQAA